MTLENNGTDAITVYGNGAFTFPAPIAQAGSFLVTVSGQPTGQLCTVTNDSASGANVTSDVSSVAISCAMAPGTWAASWADAPVNASGGAGSAQTFREILKPTVGSQGVVRLHFSNFFGTKPITLGAVHLAKQVDGAQVSGDVAVTFGGQASAVIPAGGTIVSDVTPFTFAYGDILAVTEYLPGGWTALTQHNQGPNIVTSYTTASNGGDQTGDVAGASFSTKINETYLLDRVDVFGSYKGTIAAFGSSTTDGFHSSLDKHMTYPDQLASELHAAGRDDIAIANEGIAGNEMLVDGSGQAGTTRFSRDVLALPGVMGVIDALGANDLRNSCVRASSLISGIQNIVAQAHAAGIKYYKATVAPSTFCGAQNPSGFGTRFPQGQGEEQERFAVNNWALSSASFTVDGVVEPAPVFDGIFHFSSAVSDASNWSYMLPSYDSGDNIHPNDVGYGLEAKAIPLQTFAN